MSDEHKSPNDVLDAQISSLLNTIEYIKSQKQIHCPSRKIYVDPNALIICMSCEDETTEYDSTYCDQGHHICYSCLHYCGTYIPMNTCCDFTCTCNICHICWAKTRLCSDHDPKNQVSAF
jgi:hypothetical protein